MHAIEIVAACQAAWRYLRARMQLACGVLAKARQQESLQ